MPSQFFFGTPDHNISSPYEVDAYPVQLQTGVSYTASVMGASENGGTLHDPAVLLLDHSGNVIGGQDDASTGSLIPVYHFTVPTSGAYYLAATDLYGGTGAYHTSLSESNPTGTSMSHSSSQQSN